MPNVYGVWEAKANLDSLTAYTKDITYSIDKRNIMRVFNNYDTNGATNKGQSKLLLLTNTSNKIELKAQYYFFTNMNKEYILGVTISPDFKTFEGEWGFDTNNGYYRLGKISGSKR
jgi:hypothetical protein